MSSKYGPTDGSPSASTLSLPQHRHSRRGSVGSLASTPHVDKETFSQTLDQINQHASRTGTLTTFNEYTSPPLSSSGGDGRGLAGELQGGLSGLYSRFRASVGNVRDIVIHAAENEAVVVKSHKSPKLGPPSPTSVTRSKHHLRQGSNLSTPSADAASTVLTKPDSPTLKEGNGSFTKARQTQVAKPTTSALGVSAPQTKPATTSSAPLMSPLAPLAPPTTVVSVAVAEANLSETRDDPRRAQTGEHQLHTQSASRQQEPTISRAGPLSKAEEQLNETFNKQKASAEFPNPLTNSASGTRAEDILKPVVEHTSEAAQKSNKESVSNDIGQAGQAQDVDYFTPIEKHLQPLQPPKIVMHPGTPQAAPSRKSANATMPQDTRDVDHNPAEARTKGRYPQAVTPSTPAMASPGSGESPSQSLQSLELKKTGVTSAHAKPPSSKWHDFENLTKSTAPQVKNRVLSRDFWMKDENARDCFYCGDAFSTFRRKHHCSECPPIVVEFLMRDISTSCLRNDLSNFTALLATLCS